MKLAKELTAVTTLSKSVALFIFIVSPIIFFIAGVSCKKSQLLAENIEITTENLSENNFQTDSIENLDDNVVIDFESCYVGGERISVPFGSTTIKIIGKTGENCTIVYGGEVENPDWDGRLPNTCNIPTDLGKLDFEKTSYGVDLMPISNYCQKI